MAIDRKFIGTELPPHTAVVEKGRLRFFAKAVGEANPIYSDETAARTAGHPSLPAPPTFLFCLDSERPGSPSLLELLGVDIARVLHGEQSFAYHGPIYAGDELTFTSRIGDIYDKKGGALEFIVRDTVVRNQAGKLVGELRGVIVVRN